MEATRTAPEISTLEYLASMHTWSGTVEKKRRPFNARMKEELDEEETRSWLMEEEDETARDAEIDAAKLTDRLETFFAAFAIERAFLILRNMIDTSNQSVCSMHVVFNVFNLLARKRSLRLTRRLFALRSNERL